MARMQSQLTNHYAIKLNNFSLILFREGNNSRAEKCLIRALLASTMKEMPPPADLLAMKNEYEGRDCLENSCTCLGDDGEHNYIAGMRVYFEPILLQTCSFNEMCDEMIIQKTIYFNLGIYYIRARQYEEAYVHFSKALSLHTSQCERLPPLLTNHGHPPHGPSNVMILHNLGYINYRKKRYAESFSNQSEILRILCNSCHEHSQNHIKTCLNSIGIVTMHTINSMDINKSVERRALHFFTEALADQKMDDDTPLCSSSSNEGRQSVVRKTLALVKDIGAELLQKERNEQKIRVHQFATIMY